MKIIDLKATEPKVRLYYFTGKQWGMKSLWEKRLKVSLYAEVNDPFQLAPFALSSPRSRRFWDQQLKLILAGGHGLLCFSDDWRSTVMWSHYAERHAGLCLGFDVDRSLAEPIQYIDELMADPFDKRRELRRMKAEVLESALRYKHSAWSHEREWRLRVRLTEPSDGLFFKDFDDSMHLREVIIGPGCSLTTAEIVQAIVNPPLDVDIIKARASFARFEVCEQELVSTHTSQGFRAALKLARDVFHDELPADDDATASR